MVIDEYGIHARRRKYIEVLDHTNRVLSGAQILSNMFTLNYFQPRKCSLSSLHREVPATTSFGQLVQEKYVNA